MQPLELLGQTTTPDGTDMKLTHHTIFLAHKPVPPTLL